MADITRPDKPGARKTRPTRPAAESARHSSRGRNAHIDTPNQHAKRQRFCTAIEPGLPNWSADDLALCLYRTNRADLVKIVKDGVPAHFVEVLTERMAMPKDKFYRTIGLIRPTVDRKVRAEKTLNQDESERMIGIARLVGQAQSMVQESGGSQDFDAARWVSAWLDRPLPALGGKRPGEFMDTAIGRSMVADVLGQQQSSAYG
jgi:putative toxin-antitoxin system antitoxin component (TIGR02293 family)